MHKHERLIYLIIFSAFLYASCTPPDADWKFVEITQQAGLGEFKHVNGADGGWYLPETFGGGGAFLDYDQDGLIDLALVGGATWNDSTSRGLWLYQGIGNGYFRDVTDKMGLSRVHGYGMGIISGDIDRDGDEDLYLTTLGKNYLLVNEGHRFRDATTASGLDAPPEWNVAAIFLDANRDAWLDLYVTGYVKWSIKTDLVCTRDGVQKRYCTPEHYTGTPGRFYLNQGDGTFIEHTKASGLSGSGKTLGAITMDLNRDQWPDIALANDTDPDQLFLNRQDGSFEEVGLSRGMALDPRGRARAGMGIDAGIVDSTEEPTIFIGHFENQMNGVYRYTPSGFFEERSAVSRIGPPSLPALTFGMVLLDADLDGDLDLFAANGHINPQASEQSDLASYKQLSQLFLNDGHGIFMDESQRLGLTIPMVGRGALTADIDLDGDIDILITENNGGVRLFRNDLPPEANYLRIQLHGMSVDATITLHTGSQRQFRRIRAGHSYASQSEKVVTIGLGIAQHVDSLTVFWPSGIVTRRTNIPVNQTLQLREIDL